MEAFEVKDFKDITIVESDIPEPFLTIKKQLLSFLDDEYLPRSNRLHVEAQLRELDKTILTWMLTQPIKVILKGGK